jgi:glycosyltransferase involved in cell wall biosynthesis
MVVSVRAGISVSCVISNYNYAKYIGQAVDSALAQTVPFEQVIVVDDGSKDNSVEILRAYGDRITLIEIANSGQTGACLTGFAGVSSDYIYFLDADDYLDADFIETITPLLASSPVKLQFQLRTVRAATGTTYSAFPTFSAGYDAAAMRADNRLLGFYTSPPTSGNVFRSESLRSIDFSQLNPRGAIDSTLNLLAPYFGEIISINRPFVYRRVHDDSLGQWSKPTPELLRKEIRIFQDTWLEAQTLMKWTEPAFGNSRPVYLLERTLMINALSGKFWLAGDIARYITRVIRSKEPLKQRLMLVAWALCLLPPLRQYRERTVQARRSPVNRPAFLEKLVRLLGRR